MKKYLLISLCVILSYFAAIHIFKEICSTISQNFFKERSEDYYEFYTDKEGNITTRCNRANGKVEKYSKAAYRWSEIL
jgi:hypothetical protein